jgi:hypothetical protein
VGEQHTGGRRKWAHIAAVPVQRYSESNIARIAQDFQLRITVVNECCPETSKPRDVTQYAWNPTEGSINIVDGITGEPEGILKRFGREMACRSPEADIGTS